VIVVVGLSHRTAPIEVRERAALPEEQMNEFLRELVNSEAVGEALVVSTCNRMEVVVAPRPGGVQLLEPSIEAVTLTLAGRVPGVSEHLYRLAGKDALHHLFSVASSLDSMVMGEPQILGQVKDALDAGRRAGTVGPQLTRAVGHAVRAAKRVRSETAIGAGQVSVPSVAVGLARDIFGSSLSGRVAVLVGSGEMGETAAKLLIQAGARLIIVGRNRERTEQLCRELGGEARALDQLQKTLGEADVVITATSASGFVIDLDAVKSIHKKRRGRSLFLIDLAVPRDVEPAVADLESVYLYNVDDLSKIVQDSLSTRQREAERAYEILSQEIASFGRSLDAELVTPTVVALRGRVEGILRAELDRTLKGRLKHLGAEEQEALSRMVEAQVNKLLHSPTRSLRQLATDESSRFELASQLSLLDDLFELEAADKAEPELPVLEQPPETRLPKVG
jgi:glutamyl-tRNA reductase